jgi:hypothetical protein
MRTSRGWFEYFKHSHRFTFTALDKWVRTGLRSLLRFPPRAGRSWPGLGPSTLAQCFLCQAGALLPNCCPCSGLSILAEVRPPTGEPDAGEPPVRFGGRGSGSSRSPYPLSRLAFGEQGTASRTPTCDPTYVAACTQRSTAARWWGQSAGARERTLSHFPAPAPAAAGAFMMASGTRAKATLSADGSRTFTCIQYRPGGNFSSGSCTK